MADERGRSSASVGRQWGREHKKNSSRVEMERCWRLASAVSCFAIKNNELIDLRLMSGYLDSEM